MNQKKYRFYYIEFHFLSELIGKSSAIAGTYSEDGALAAAGISGLRGNSRGLEEEIARSAEPEIDKLADNYDEGPNVFQRFGQRVKNLFGGEGFKTNHQVFEKYEKLDNDYIQSNHEARKWNKDVSDDAQGRGKYVVTLSTVTEQGRERLKYYEHAASRYGEDLDEQLKNKEFVVFGQEGKGVGAMTRAGEPYNDRITYITKGKNGNYIIDEFYRSSLDVGIANANSISSQKLDIMLGNHRAEFGFNVFDFEGNIDRIANEKIKNSLIEKYNNNGLSWDNIRKDDYFDKNFKIVRLDSISSINRLTGEIKKRTQTNINVHQLYQGAFYNLGCPGILKQDYKSLRKRFSDKIYQKNVPGKIGRFYVFQ